MLRASISTAVNVESKLVCCTNFSCLQLLKLTSFTASAEFHVTPQDVYLKFRADRHGRQQYTGIAYVWFAGPHIAKQVRISKHRQRMGARYIECFTTPAIITPASMSTEMTILNDACNTLHVSNCSFTASCLGQVIIECDATPPTCRFPCD